MPQKPRPRPVKRQRKPRKKPWARVRKWRKKSWKKPNPQEPVSKRARTRIEKATPSRSPSRSRTCLGSKSDKFSAIFEDRRFKGVSCQGGSTGVFAKRWNNHPKATVPVAVQENIVPLRVTKATRSIHIANGPDPKRCPSERNPPRDQTTPCVLADGVVSSTGVDSTGDSSMSSRIDCARW